MRTRAILAVGIAVLLPPSGTQAAILAGYNFGPSVPAATLAPTTLDANVTATPITNDPGMLLDLTSPATAPPSAPYLRTTMTATTPNEAAAFTSNTDFQFTITAGVGFELDLSSFTFNVMRGGASEPRGYAVRSSVDGFSTVLSTMNVPTVRPTFTPVTVDLSGSVFQNLNTITFKIYSYSPGTGSSVDYDDLVLNGIASTLPAGSYTWTGATNNLWNTTAPNWTGSGTVYVDATLDSNAIFGDSGANTSISVPAPLAPRSLSFTNATVPYTFSGSSITASNSINKTGDAGVTFTNTVSAATMNIAGGSITVGTGGVLTSPGLTVGPAGALNVLLGGGLGETTSLIADGPVNLDVPTSIASLRDNGMFSGVVTLNGVTLTISGGANYGGLLTGSGGLLKTTGGVQVLTNPGNNYAGGTVITGGALQLSAVGAGSTGDILVSGGALVAGAGITNNITLAGGRLGSAGNPTITGALTVTADSMVATFNAGTGAASSDVNLTGLLTGTGNIQIQTVNGNNPDAQAFRLRGPSSLTYTGTIFVPNSGKFELQQNGGVTIGSPMGTGSIVLTAGTNPTTNQGTYSLVNVRNNSGGDTLFGNAVTVVGTGVTYFNLLGNSPAGSTTTFGLLRIGDGQALGAVATASNAYTVAFSTVLLTGGNATFTPQPVGNTNFLSVENILLGDIEQEVPGAGIIMNGAARLTLAGANTYTGPTDIQSGTLAVAASGSIATSAEVRLSGFASKLDILAFGPTGYPIPADQRITGVGDWDGELVLSGTLVPGLGFGTMTGDDLTLETDSTLQFELSTVDNISDHLVLSGAFLRGTAGPFVFDFEAGGRNGELYTLVQYATTDVLVSDFSYTDLAPGLQGIFLVNPNELQFVVIPEPGSAAVLALVLGGMLGLRRRR